MEKILFVFASPEERQRAAVLEHCQTPFSVGHLDHPEMLMAAVARIQPSLVALYCESATEKMLRLLQALRDNPDKYSGLGVLFFPAHATGNVETALENGADGMLVNVWEPDELIVRIGALLKVGRVNRENARRARALAQASAEAADIILQLEEADRKIREQNAFITAQQEKIAANLAAVEREMRLASLLQVSLLPSTREYSQGSGLVLSDRYIPATELGGDYFDYVRCPDGRLFICMGDVTGHGVAAALVSVQMRALARSHITSGQGVAALLSDLNSYMFATFQREYLMTMAVLCYSPATGQIEYAGAGHCPLMHYESAKRACRERRSRGVPLGVLEDSAFPSEFFALEPGDCLLVYSDGITEVENAAGEEFGSSRLLAEFSKAVAAGEAEIPETLIASARRHAKDGVFNDDVSLVTVARPAE